MYLKSCGVHTHTLDYHSAMRKKEILPFVRTKIDVEGIMLTEISHTEKDKHSMMSLNTWKLKKPDTEKK